MTRPFLLGIRGLAALDHLMAQRPLLAFDFDGTLAPIVARPDDACMSLAVSDRLAKLAQQLPVVIITGRTVRDVRSRLGFVPTDVVGSHGSEDATSPINTGTVQALDPARDALHACGNTLQRLGVSVEDKGLSLALHYRLAPRPSDALQAIQSLLATLPPTLRSFSGKMVENIVPADAPDKGQAMLRLVQRYGAQAAFFAGDDVNDEPVFTLAPPTWLTLRVGRDVAATRARYFVDGPADMPQVLQAMLDRLAPARP